MAEMKQSPSIAIIGGGVAGLATALQIMDTGRDKGLSPRVAIFEKDEDTGGNLQTYRQDGFQLEWGPNGFLDNEPATLRLVDRLEMRDQLQCSEDASRIRFLLIHGRLCELPMSPPAFIKSKMLPWRAKLRMAQEFFLPRRPGLGLEAEDPANDETVYDFGVRRLGRDFAETMLDPMVKGIFGGDARNLSLAAAFPRMVELEKDYGSLFKALIRISKEKKKAADAGPSGTLHSFQGGMKALPAKLTQVLGADRDTRILTGADVQSVRRDDQGGTWSVQTSTGVENGFDAAINCAPAHAAAKQLAGTPLSAMLQRIPYVPMAVITLGFDRDQVEHDLNGFGMLIPTFEKRDLLGVLWTSSIFTGRAPDGKLLLRCMAGGPGHMQILDNSDQELIDMTLADIRRLFGIHGQPTMKRVLRHGRAIAQYVPGHPALLKGIETELANHKGLYLTGSSYKGVAVNYCVKEAEITAAKVIDDLS
jgi:protoporphyrinogen/coproporphyrinogen III oxidase